MTEFFKNLKRQQEDRKQRISLHPITVFESYEKIHLCDTDACGTLLDTLIDLVDGCSDFINPSDAIWLKRFLLELSQFEFETSFTQEAHGRPRKKKVKYLLLTYLETAVKEWVLSYDKAESVNPLASSYALMTAEFIDFALGREKYRDQKYFRLGLFDTENLSKFWSNNDFLGFSFLSDKNFKRVFSSRMKKPIMKGVVPEGGNIKAGRKTVFGPGKEFFFIPKRCYLSEGFDEYFMEQYFYGHFHCLIQEKLKYQFTEEPYIKGALTKNLDADPSTRIRDSVYTGELPLKWIVAYLEKDPSLPKGFRTHPI